MWLLIAFGVAVSEATKDVFHSQERVKPLSPLLKAWAITTTSLPVLLITLGIKGIPEIQPKFRIFVTAHAILLSGAFVLYMRALALGPLSQTQPVLALTTVFLTVTNPLMTNDRVSWQGWVGVVAVGVGIYATQHPGRDSEGKLAGFWSPFVEMIRQPGVFSKLCVAIIFSITANLDKLCLEAASGPFYLAVDQALVSAMLGGVLLIQRVRGIPFVRRDAPVRVAHPSYLLVGGSINACTILLHMWALTLVPVPFVIAVKCISIIFTSTWGYLVRKERAPHWYRLVGTAAVVAGVMLIIFFGKA